MSNNTYMCILRNSDGGCEKPSPTDMEAMYAKYQAWQTRFSDNILDMGGKLGSDSAVVRNDGVTDGPFVEVKEIIGGYMLLSAANLDEAVDVINNSPMVENPGVSIEIRDISTS